MQLSKSITVLLAGFGLVLSFSAAAQTSPYDELLAKLEAEQNRLQKEVERQASEAGRGAGAPSAAPRIQGLRPSQIAGVAYDPGEMELVFNYRTSQTLPEWTGEGIYLILKDGSAHLNPDVSPTDLDVAQSRRANSSRWLRSADLGFKKSEIFPPRPRGYTLDIYVERPETSSTVTATFTEWKSLRLTRAGRFETGRTSLASSAYGNGSGASTVTSSGPDGAFTSATGGVSGGGATVFNKSKSSSGNHSGHYLIEGATIELRYDNGQIVRALFGTDARSNVILGDTNYWTPGTRDD